MCYYFVASMFAFGVNLGKNDLLFATDMSLRCSYML